MAMSTGDKAFAEKQYARALLSYRAAGRAKPTSAEPEYKTGVTYLAMLDAQSAANHLWAAAKIDPNHSPTQLKLAELLSLNENLDLVREAERRAKSVLAITPDNIDAVNALALSELRLGKDQEAEERLLKTLTLSPGHLKTAVSLAEVHLKRKDTAGAEAILKSAAEKEPRTAIGWTTLARFYENISRIGEAEAALRQALAIDGNNGLTLTRLAGLLERTGRLSEAEQIYARLSSLPAAGNTNTAHAAFLLRQKRYPDAIGELRHITERDSGNRAARNLLLRAYVDSGDRQNAEKLLDRALSRNANDAEPLLLRAQFYSSQGKLAEAERDARTVLHFDPNSATAHHVLATVYGLQDKNLQRRQELNEVLRLDPFELPTRLELARAFGREQNYELGRQILDAAPAQQQVLLPFIIVRNEMLLALGDEVEARRGIDRGLQLERHPELLLQESLWRLNRKEYTAARNAVEEALRLSPGNVKALNCLALVFLRQGQGAVALQRVREHAALNPNSPDVQYFAAQFLETAGNRAEAQSAYGAVLSARPQFTPAAIALARLQLAQGQTDAAAASLERVASTDSRSWEARLLLGNLHASAGNSAAALAQYEKALQIAPTNPLVLNNFAYTLAEYTPRIDEALKYAELAVEAAPDSASARDTLGWIYHKKGLSKSAVNQFELAVAKEATPRRRYHLAIACLASGDAARGERELRAAEAADPNLPEARIARDLLMKASKE